MEERVFNFAAGPSTMPVEILEDAQKNLVNYKGTGLGVMEMSHRSKPYQAIIDKAESDLREIMNIPDDYDVLFLQGGATTQFSMVPMNLAHQGEKMGYILSGNFSKKAYEEGQRWGEAKVIASSKEKNFTYIPKVTRDMIEDGMKFVHMCGNNTIFGTSYNYVPDTGNVPLVADWSSAILGKQIDVTKYDLVYAGAQKNMGIAGLTVAIVKKGLVLDPVDPVVPIMLRYNVHAENGSMYNTPPCFAIYMAGLMFDWVKRQGGVAEMEKRNIEKASLLYDLIDNSKIFTNPVVKEDRSIMNVVFTLPTEEMTTEFLDMVKGRNMINVKGHRLVGGCRASIYNGMTLDGVKTLAKCMEDFEKGLRK